MHTLNSNTKNRNTQIEKIILKRYIPCKQTKVNWTDNSSMRQIKD